MPLPSASGLPPSVTLPSCALGSRTVARVFAGTSTASSKRPPSSVHAELTRPVHRLVARLHARESAAGPRLDEDVLVAGGALVGLDAGHHPVHPLADRAVRVVVERVHRAVLEAAVRLLAVPPLPDRGGALLHRVEPRRVLLAVEQQVRLVQIAVPAQHVAEVRRAEEARRQVLPLADLLGQPLRRDRSQLLGQQVELQREDVGGLRVLADAAPSAHELVAGRRP